MNRHLAVVKAWMTRKRHTKATATTQQANTFRPFFMPTPIPASRIVAHERRKQAISNAALKALKRGLRNRAPVIRLKGW